MGIVSGYQKTLANPITLAGIGVHSGDPATVHFLPADPDTGIVFHRADADGKVHEIRALASEIGATDFCTSLGIHGVKVDTVEHLMAAVMAMEIDNLVIEIDGPEVPILDGASIRFIEAFDEAGIVAQAANRRFIRVLKTVRVEAGGSWAEFRPHDNMRFEVEIDYDCPLIGRQRFASDMNSEIFRREIARARTFGFMKDVEKLWASGHALGSSLDNSVVIGDDNAVINPGGLRFPDEFVRHKTLDAVGDLALAGSPFIGCFRSYRSGHRLNTATLRALLADRSAFEIAETAGQRPRERPAASLAR
ncbi:UDP-3-O-acyl-N-acetylglucosamine deacetylase [Phyllobacterium leguminum]|uniref:UDP-3-O-acyl-N-acetylglucosamine deacetylase n=1 Tax=Phyllobacterium leguminum TaxID=314237 RepID=A0A318T6S6_9HYPH|nr:UDP-3-O-acyl-N-acetylglucosamine deacetylase [Phyllobacterium leguminum]PYE90152.1 UDP-3-O-[3-hydroxymyristoyl] N-acetylglucosamine deacetylase [Phyllobacterium leguminum]